MPRYMIVPRMIGSINEFCGTKIALQSISSRLSKVTSAVDASRDRLP